MLSTNDSGVFNVREALDWVFNKFQMLMAKDIKLSNPMFPDNETVEDALVSISENSIASIEAVETKVTANTDGWTSLPVLNGATGTIEYLEQGNTVYLRGFLSGITDNKIIGVLPIKYWPTGRPRGYTCRAASASHLFCYVRISENGEIITIGPQTNQTMIDNISFHI